MGDRLGITRVVGFHVRLPFRSFPTFLSFFTVHIAHYYIIVATGFPNNIIVVVMHTGLRL